MIISDRISAHLALPSFQFGYAHDGYVVATWRNALLMMWTGAITSTGLDATERGGKMLERRYKNEQIAKRVQKTS